MGSPFLHSFSKRISCIHLNCVERHKPMEGTFRSDTNNLFPPLWKHFRVNFPPWFYGRFSKYWRVIYWAELGLLRWKDRTTCSCLLLLTKQFEQHCIIEACAYCTIEACVCRAPGYPHWPWGLACSRWPCRSCWARRGLGWPCWSWPSWTHLAVLLIELFSLCLSCTLRTWSSTQCLCLGLFLD